MGLYALRYALTAIDRATGVTQRVEVSLPGDTSVTGTTETLKLSYIWNCKVPPDVKQQAISIQLLDPALPTAVHPVITAGTVQIENGPTVPCISSPVIII